MAITAKDAGTTANKRLPRFEATFEEFGEENEVEDGIDGQGKPMKATLASILAGLPAGSSLTLRKAKGSEMSTCPSWAVASRHLPFTISRLPMGSRAL